MPAWEILLQKQTLLSRGQQERDVIDRRRCQFARSCRRQAVERLSRRVPLGVCCFTKSSGLMATPEADQDMQDAMTALNTLISGRQRKDGRTWETAYEYMQVYLEVGPSSCLAHMMHGHG